MSRGPKLEQIENHDYPTFRVELESADGRRTTVDDCELMESSAATAEARRLSKAVNKSYYAAICVVNERTGFTRDRISWAKPGCVLVGCPDCGIVEVKPDVYEGGKAISGPCGVCGDRLHFA